MARQLQVAIDCRDPGRLAAFWAEALDYQVADAPPGYADWAEFSRAMAGEPGEAWSRVVDGSGHGPPLMFHRVPEPKLAKNRVHLDVRLLPGAGKGDAKRAVDAEVSRLVALGATNVRTDEDESDYYAVMQDPEGNEFCVG
jgi:glyoxalase superfamily protein